jgi:hypothetical protein
MCDLAAFAFTIVKKTSGACFLPGRSLQTSLTAIQGCQIYLGTTYQNGEKFTKLPQNITNGHKTYQTVVKYSKLP